MSKQICKVDWDDCYSVSTEDDSVYFDVVQTEEGWYLSVDLDCESGSFTTSITVDDGPYPTEDDALRGGIRTACSWMSANYHYDYEVDSRLIKRGLASNPTHADEE
jgi:hypothetical protein